MVYGRFLESIFIFCLHLLTFALFLDNNNTDDDDGAHDDAGSRRKRCYRNPCSTHDACGRKPTLYDDAPGLYAVPATTAERSRTWTFLYFYECQQHPQATSSCTSAATEPTGDDDAAGNHDAIHATHDATDADDAAAGSATAATTTTTADNFFGAPAAFHPARSLRSDSGPRNGGNAGFATDSATAAAANAAAIVPRWTDVVVQRIARILADTGPH